MQCPIFGFSSMPTAQTIREIEAVQQDIGHTTAYIYKHLEDAWTDLEVFLAESDKATAAKAGNDAQTEAKCLHAANSALAAHSKNVSDMDAADKRLDELNNDLATKTEKGQLEDSLGLEVVAGVQPVPAAPGVPTVAEVVGQANGRPRLFIPAGTQILEARKRLKAQQERAGLN